MSAKPANHTLPLLGNDFWTLGRSRENSIALSDEWVSRKHAILRFTEIGYYLVDLASQNGSFVNDQPVRVPVLLKNGDRLRVGKTQFEFHNPLSAAETPTAQPQTVVISPSSKIQGNIWHALLISQGLRVIWEPANIKPQQLEQFNLSQQPDLLLVDLEAQRPNPYDFCRWCRQHYPQIKIILTSSSRSQISPVECRWAQSQGAVDLLPGFPVSDLIEQRDEIAAILNFVLTGLDQEPILPDSLLPELKMLQAFIVQKPLDSGDPTQLALTARS